MNQTSLIPTASNIQKAFYRSNVQRYEIVAPNIFLTHTSNEMDIIAIRKSSFVDEIEIKISHSDFKADFKKTIRGYQDEYPWIKHDTLKHDELKAGNLECNYFSFLVPVELEDKCDIPDYAGLYVFKQNRVRGYVHEIKKAPLLHRRKITDNLKYHIGRKMAYRYWEKVS